MPATRARTCLAGDWDIFVVDISKSALTNRIPNTFQQQDACCTSKNYLPTETKFASIHTISLLWELSHKLIYTSCV